MIAVLLALMSAGAGATELTGMVVDAGGNPVSGAWVHIYTAAPRIGPALCPSCYRDCGKQARTDGNGEFRLQELDRTLLFDLLVLADGYESEFVKGVDPATGALPVALNTRPADDPAKVITGVILDPEGRPLGGATVTPHGYHQDRRKIIWGRWPGVELLSITNAQGEFALRIPDPDRKLDVRVTSRSFATKIEREIGTRERRRIRLTEGVLVSGRVTRAGEPVSGVRIKALHQNRVAPFFLGWQEIATNEQGLFVFSNLAPEQTYIVHVPRGGGLTAEPKVVQTGADGTSIDAGTLALVSGRRIGGTIVLDGNVTVPPDARIRVRAGDLGDIDEIPVRNGAFLLEAVMPGEVELELWAGNLRFADTTHGFEPQRGHVVLAGEEDCLDMRVVLERR